MKPEPLAKKYEEYAKGLWYDNVANRRLTQEANEVLDDVKSSAEWLISEIEKTINEVEKEQEEDKYDTAYKNGYLNALDDIEDLIKKAFEGVVE